MEERRGKLPGRRTADNSVEQVTNGWKEHQKLVIQILKEGQENLRQQISESHKEFRGEIKELRSEMNAKIHSTPCHELGKVSTKMDTGVRIIRWFITPVVVALIGAIIALLFKLFSNGGVT